jgi:Flp pilus assembly protein TadG
MEPSLRAKRSNPGIVGHPRTSGLLRRCAPRNDGTLTRLALALWRDTDGLMVPYVAVMLPVLVGFALLALDGSRRMSLQTQMQAAADSLALAGARELNKQAGAESRAISAMANAHAATKSSNTLFGAGSSPILDYTFVFYSSLSAASDGIGGATATGDSTRNTSR